MFILNAIAAAGTIMLGQSATVQANLNTLPADNQTIQDCTSPYATYHPELHCTTQRTTNAETNIWAATEALPVVQSICTNHTFQNHWYRIGFCNKTMTAPKGSNELVWETDGIDSRSDTAIGFLPYGV